MNSQTRERLIEFIDQIQELAVGTIHMIGVEKAKEIIDSGIVLKTALEHDETIKESR